MNFSNGRYAVYIAFAAKAVGEWWRSKKIFGQDRHGFIIY